METLQNELDRLIATLPNVDAFRANLETLVSVYPFNDYEYMIATLLAADKLTHDEYIELRDGYMARNRFMYIFEISAPRGFGDAWAQDHLKELVPDLQNWVLASKEVASNQYYSAGQHRGNTGEGQLHLKDDNIRKFAQFEAKSNELAGAIRKAYERQMEA